MPQHQGVKVFVLRVTVDSIREVRVEIGVLRYCNCSNCPAVISRAYRSRRGWVQAPSRSKISRRSRYEREVVEEARMQRKKSSMSGPSPTSRCQVWAPQTLSPHKMAIKQPSRPWDTVTRRRDQSRKKRDRCREPDATCCIALLDLRNKLNN